MQSPKGNYAFIDSQNVHLSVKDQGWSLDFARFRVYLRDKYHVTKSFLFIGYVPGNEPLYRKLRWAGHVIVFKPTVMVKKGNKVDTKGNVDAELVLQAMIEYSHYEKAVIITGDGDFYCLVKYLLGKHKLARLLVPNQKKYSRLFLPFKKHMDYMNSLKQKLGVQTTNKKGSVALRTKP